MFRLELHELIFVYAGLSLGIILLAALLHNLRRNRCESQAARGLVKCHLCAFEFRDDTGIELPRCPSCDALADRTRISRL